MEEENQDFFDKSEENIIDAEEIPKYEGVCSRCLGSDFVITERNGVMGVVFSSFNTDSEGVPIKVLVPCDCGVEVNY